MTSSPRRSLRAPIVLGLGVVSLLACHRKPLAPGHDAAATDDAANADATSLGGDAGSSNGGAGGAVPDAKGASDGAPDGASDGTGAADGGIEGPNIGTLDCPFQSTGGARSVCADCHTTEGRPNPRYPDLFAYKGTQAAFLEHVRTGGDVMAPYPATAISDADAIELMKYFQTHTRGPGSVSLHGAQPLFAPADAKNPPVTYTRADGAIITRGAGRARARHEKEPTFATYIPQYFEDRSFGFTIEDFTPTGPSRIRVTYLPDYLPGMTSFHSFKEPGDNATFLHNDFLVNAVDPPVTPTAPFKAVQQSDVTTPPAGRSIDVGQLLEFELWMLYDMPESQRMQYYTDTFRYQCGVGGLTPENRDFPANLGPLPDAQLGGATTIGWLRNEPALSFSQMAMNMQMENVQAFLEGRRLFTTDFATGKDTDGVSRDFVEQAGKAGPLSNATSCTGCHLRNGRGTLLDGPLSATSSMVFKLYDAGALGEQLALQEGSASVTSSVAKIVMLVDGTTVTLQRPVFAAVSKLGDTTHFSARVAQPLLGLGLLEAIDEQTILGHDDRVDCDRDGISGRANFVKDPQTGVFHVGRFGWKAETATLAQQAAHDASQSLGVGTSLFPDETGKAELADADLAKVATYLRLGGVPPQRIGTDVSAAADIKKGSKVFQAIGCAKCHVSDVVTISSHPFSELRVQAVKPYTDLLLHDMGPDLADASAVPSSTLVEAPPSASEWRTPPLWGLGLHKTVNGHDGLLHDGRAADVQEAILWHGGEAEKIKVIYVTMPAADRAALLAFLQSL